MSHVLNDTPPPTDTPNQNQPDQALLVPRQAAFARRDAPSPKGGAGGCPLGTPSRRTGRKPEYTQYEGFRPARREHAPDAAP
ncbi:hypothetical protein Kpho01_76050 [Kitasatospora phosalacinea]|uniref:Uncharacterized protein n=1 Tax=Kitasatospora phosalacinea TaxID=2065 RepID=A0A9W6UUI1_9ACTN|nr:hypothetical protein Kpho01_76050 [Kitasatospora phosalacinea]